MWVIQDSVYKHQETESLQMINFEQYELYCMTKESMYIKGGFTDGDSHLVITKTGNVLKMAIN